MAAVIRTVDQVAAWYHKQEQERDAAREGERALSEALYNVETLTLSLKDLREKFDRVLTEGGVDKKDIDKWNRHIAQVDSKISKAIDEVAPLIEAA